MTGGVPLTVDEINASFGRIRDDAHRLMQIVGAHQVHDTSSSHASASFPGTDAL
jgi:hypothetical protein